MQTKKIRLLPFLFLIFTGANSFCVPLSGTYTIGGTSPNYATFSLAVSDLLNNGVNGPVTFNVASGTYIEQVTIPAISGASSSNMVTFRSATGNASDVILTCAPTSSSNWVVGLNGANYIRLQNLTIRSTGSFYTTVINIYNSASNDTISNSILTAPVTIKDSVNNAVVNLSSDISNCNNDAVIGSALNNGSYGLYSYFHSPSTFIHGLYIEYNSFIDQYAGAIYNYRVLSAKIKNNYITTNSTDTGYNGIKIYTGQDTICNNRIYNCPGTGINFEGCSPYMFNNMIEITGSAVNYGININWDNYCGDYVYVSANTVLVLNTNKLSAALYFPYPYSYVDYPFNYIRDNALINRGGGYAINLQDTVAVSPSRFNIHQVVDYNDYYTTGVYLGKWDVKTATTLTNWQATIDSCLCGADGHSINVNPAFVSDTDLRISTDDLRYGTHAQEAGPLDIFGNSRNITTPDMGAYEYTGPVNVNTAAFTANDTTICAGNTVNFTDQTTNNPTAWSWTFSGGTPDTSSSRNPAIDYNTAGSYNVQLVVTTGSGVDTLLKSSYITVNPAGITGTISATPDPVCSGGSVRLLANGSAGNLQWQSSFSNNNFQNISNPAATDSSLTLSLITLSFYFRLVAVNGTCSDTSAIHSVTVNPLPTPVVSTADSLICSSDSTRIALNQNFASYLWNNGDTINYTYANDAGGVWVTVTDTNGCMGVSNHLSISVFPAPSISLEINGDTLSSHGAVSYQWYGGDTAIANATGAIYIVQQTGYYSLQITDSNGCKAQSTAYFVTANGIQNLISGNEFTIYPNPFNAYLFIQRSNNGVELKTIEIYNELGQKVFSNPEGKSPNKSEKLNLSALPVGMYSVKLTTSSLEQIWKVVKQ